MLLFKVTKEDYNAGDDSVSLRKYEDPVTSDDYCVDRDNNSTELVVICSLEKIIDPIDCDINRWYTTAIIISIIFIILAILAHIIETQLNDSMFGKISLVYLFNLLGCFITLMVDTMNNFEWETLPCEMVAYMLQYFTLSISFSINILAYICFRTVRQMADTSDYKSVEAFRNFFDPRRKYFLLKGIAYIQGLPLIISLITYAIDNIRKRREAAGEKDLYLFPNAGVVYCYMSFHNPWRNVTYFLTPGFIYVQSFELFILFINLIIFAVTVKSYFKFQVTSDNVKKIEQRKKDLKIIIQLFFNIHCFWILEVITSTMSSYYGTNETCIVMFVLVAPNAFYGLLAFLMLVCMKPTVVKSLKAKILSIFDCSSSVSTRESTMNGTKLTDIYFSQ